MGLEWKLMGIAGLFLIPLLILSLFLKSGHNENIAEVRLDQIQASYPQEKDSSGRVR